MNIQIYFVKKNFDVQKAERFFKERRIPYQLMDMKKTPPGRRELQLFAQQAGGAKKLLNAEDIKVRSHPCMYTPDEDSILDYIAAQPELMITPVVRNGRKITLGNGESVWRLWAEQEKE